MDNNSQIMYVSDQQKSKDETQDLDLYMNVKTRSLNLLKTESCHQFFQKNFKPDIAIFDGYQSEHIFNQFIYKQYPHCVRVMLMQNFQGLEQRRREIHQISKDSKILNNQELLQAVPQVNQNKKEFVSLLRSDVVLVASQYDQILLKNSYKIQSKLVSLFCSVSLLSDTYNFQSRSNFVWFGDLSNQYEIVEFKILVEKIWPQIEKNMPQTQLHVYSKNNLFKNTKSIKYFVSENTNFLKDYKALLLPVLLNSGLQSKITEAWTHSLPVITTPLGAEGLIDVSNDILSVKNNILQEYYKYDNKNHHNDIIFGGMFDNYNINQFAQSSIKIHSNKIIWENCVKNAHSILRQKLKLINLYRLSFHSNHKILQKILSQSQVDIFDNNQRYKA